MARKPKAEEPAGPPAPLTDAEIVLVAAAEAEVRERARAERVRASGSLLDEALFRPGPGDAIGRASEVLPGEDAEFSEARTVAEVFNQTWCPDSIDVMLNYRLAWGRRFRSEGVLYRNPPPLTLPGAGAPGETPKKRGLLDRILGRA